MTQTASVFLSLSIALLSGLLLSRLAKKVLLVHRRDELRATKIYREPLLNAENVELVWDSTVTGITTDKRVNGVEILNLKSGDVTNVPCDGVFVSIGRRPATEFLDGALSLDEMAAITKRTKAKPTLVSTGMKCKLDPGTYLERRENKDTATNCYSRFGRCRCSPLRRGIFKLKSNQSRWGLVAFI